MMYLDYVTTLEIMDTNCWLNNFIIAICQILIFQLINVAKVRQRVKHKPIILSVIGDFILV